MRGHHVWHGNGSKSAWKDPGGESEHSAEMDLFGCRFHWPGGCAGDSDWNRDLVYGSGLSQAAEGLDQPGVCGRQLRSDRLVCEGDPENPASKSVAFIPDPAADIHCHKDARDSKIKTKIEIISRPPCGLYPATCALSRLK